MVFPLGRPASVQEDLLPLAALHDILRHVGLLRLANGVLHPTKAAGDEVETVRRLRRTRIGGCSGRRRAYTRSSPGSSVCYTADLDAPNWMADPQLRPYAQHLLDSLTARDEATMLDRVREVIELLLPTGRCSTDQVARSLDVDRRTVHRRLAQAGTTFSSVLDDTRADLAIRLVQSRRRSLTEVAALLGYLLAQQLHPLVQGPTRLPAEPMGPVRPSCRSTAAQLRRDRAVSRPPRAKDRRLRVTRG